MIENFTKKYQKSAEEKTDLLAMYTKYKGDMDKIMESVPCCTITDEPRFSEIIHDAIKTKEVKSYKAFTNGSYMVSYFLILRIASGRQPWLWAP